MDYKSKDGKRYPIQTNQEKAGVAILIVRLNRLRDKHCYMTQRKSLYNVYLVNPRGYNI